MANVLDIRMGRPDSGWNVLEEVRRDPALADIPVIVCSTDQREVQEHGADLHRHRAEVLPKPFNLDALLSMVHRLIRRWPDVSCRLWITTWTLARGTGYN